MQSVLCIIAATRRLRHAACSACKPSIIRSIDDIVHQLDYQPSTRSTVNNATSSNMLPGPCRRLALSTSKTLWGFSSKPNNQPSLLPKHRQSNRVPTLTELFDLPSTLNASLVSSSIDPSSPTTGLFGQSHLISPSTLRTLSQSCVLHSQLLLRRLHLAPERGPRELRLVVKNFDRLSDKLCSVIDLCEVLVTCHPETKWRREAESVHADLCRLMMSMNVDQGLYEVRPVCYSFHLGDDMMPVDSQNGPYYFAVFFVLFLFLFASSVVPL